MGTYGPHFDFLQTPYTEDRLGRYVASADAPILIGAPVRVPTGEEMDGDGRLPLELADAAVAPVKTRHGILVWENPTADTPGLDPLLNAWSDVNVAPAGAPVQLCSGSYVRIRYSNLAEVLHYGRTYPARTMVAGLGATPTLNEGDFLTPGPGDDAGGYWTKTSNATLAWLIVDRIYPSGEIDAQMRF